MVERSSSFGQNSGQKKKPESTPEKNAKPKEPRIESSQNSAEQLSPVSSPRFGGGATYTNPVTSEHPPQIQIRSGHNNLQEPNAA